MRTKLASLLLPALLVGLIPAAVVAGPRSEAQQRHEAAVAFWTADRIAAAIPRDIIRDPVADDLVATPAAAAGQAAAVPAKGKPTAAPSPTPTPTPTPVPSPTPSPTPTPVPSPTPSVTTGQSWEYGGAALAGVGRVFFVMGAFLYSCSGTVTTDSQSGYSLVLTAGHCVIDKGKFATNWIFIPEYDSNPVKYNDCANSKYGCWTAQALFVHENFAAQNRFNTTAVLNDWAFALMGPGGRSGTDSLEATVGGTFGISFTPPTVGTSLTAIGYPAGAPYDGTQLTFCRGPIGEDPAMSNQTWSMGCDMTGGSSGGNWATGDPLTYGGAVLRSLNSYGYNNDPHMYGPKFNTRTLATYNAANSGITVNTRVSGG